MWCLCWCEDLGRFGTEIMLLTCWVQGVGEPLSEAFRDLGDAREGSVCRRVSVLRPRVPQA